MKLRIVKGLRWDPQMLLSFLRISLFFLSFVRQDFPWLVFPFVYSLNIVVVACIAFDRSF